MFILFRRYVVPIMFDLLLKVNWGKLRVMVSGEGILLRLVEQKGI